MSSFVETTLPPGYGQKSVWDPDMISQSHRWYTVGRHGPHCDTRTEAYRTAWRHWTAAALRRHDIDWRYSDVECGEVAAIASSGIVDVYTSALGYAVEVYGDHLRGQRDFGPDIDEAMARFAALAIALEGTVKP